MRFAIDPEDAAFLAQRNSPDVSASIPAIANLTIVLAKLDVSLGASRKALLALDRPAIEQRTREQIALIKELAVALDAAKLPADATAESSNQPLRFVACGLQGELQDRAVRVRHAARLQLALLARAQRKLRALANGLAGSHTTYESFLGMGRNVLSRPIEVCTTNPRGKLDPCQA